MIAQKKIAEAASLLQLSAPGATVILFGSYARGNAHEDSDLDFLVVEPELGSSRNESVRLRDVLRPMGLPVDILVTSRRIFEEWSTVPGSVLNQAACEGRILGVAS